MVIVNVNNPFRFSFCVPCAPKICKAITKMYTKETQIISELLRHLVTLAQ